MTCVSLSTLVHVLRGALANLGLVKGTAWADDVGSRSSLVHAFGEG